MLTKKTAEKPKRINAAIVGLWKKRHREILLATKADNSNDNSNGTADYRNNNGKDFNSLPKKNIEVPTFPEPALTPLSNANTSLTDFNHPLGCKKLPNISFTRYFIKKFISEVIGILKKMERNIINRVITVGSPVEKLL